jgi:hypothetical protein
MSTCSPALAPSFANIAWLGADIAQQREWIYEFTPSDIVELTDALATWSAKGLPREALQQEAFPLQTLAPRCKEWLRDLEHGRGFVLLRGLPIDRFSLQDSQTIYYGLSQYLGMPVSQTKQGNLLAFVEDIGKDIHLPTVRGHQTNAELPFHSDRCDIIGLLCVRQAREGGVSRLVSAAALHETLRNERPDLLEVLYQPFPQDRRGEEGPGEQPWMLLPIFACVNDQLITRYIRRFISSVRRFADAPVVTPAQVEALDFLDTLIERPGMILDMDFQPGDIQFINNYTLLHSRTAFADWEEPSQRRLLIRLWLASYDGRTLPDSFLPLYGSVTGGTLRGGVWPDTHPQTCV